jgi:thiosulfate/3-mercaptopyruvate sulfurtransferase
MRYAIFLLIAVFTGPQIVHGVNAGMLISTDTLAKRLGDNSLVILHVGSQKDYDAGHIPGARLITLSDISVTGERGLRVELPPAEALVTALGKLGIGDTSKVIIYPATDAVQAATRVWETALRCLTAASRCGVRRAASSAQRFPSGRRKRSRCVLVRSW